MAKGTLFGSIHSSRDLGLIQQKCEIGPAIPKTNLISVPGADGSKDLTEALGVGVKYEDRTITWTFALYPGDDWYAKQSEVSNALNGRRLHIIPDGLSGWYFDGRISVTEYASDRLLRQITVEAICKPYKIKQDDTVFSCAAGGSMSVVNGRMPVVPNVEVYNNLIKYPYADDPPPTLGGVAYTEEGGVVTAQGTATAYGFFYFGINQALSAGVYTIAFSGVLSGCYLKVYDSTNKTDLANVLRPDKPVTFTVPKDTTGIKYYLFAAPNVAIDVCGFPMLSKGPVALDPVLYVSSAPEAIVSCLGSTVALAEGEHIIPDFMLPEGATDVETSGTGGVKIRFREGSL